MLKFDLCKTHNNLPLFHFKGEIKASAICAVFGDSGAGKTSFVRAVAGLDNDFNGILEFKNSTWQNSKQFIKTENRKVGMVFQEPRLFPHLDALGNLKLACKKAKISLFTIAELANLLDFEDLLTKKIDQLSGGQKQRIAIARAILTGPELLIMDEPLSSLDHHSRQLLLPFIKKLSADLPIIYITHSMQEVFYLSSQMILINQGEIEAIGAAQSLFLDSKLSLVKHHHCAMLLTVEEVVWDPQHSITKGKLDGQDVVLATAEKSVQQSLQIKVESIDVIIATERLQACSLQNCLSVCIAKIETISQNKSLLTLNTGKQKLLAKITQKSVHELQLQETQQVFAYIKAVSILGDDL